MAKINTTELSKELIAKVMQCESADELIEVAKEEGIELTQDEAEAYLAELEDVELDSADLKQVAGAGGWCSLCADHAPKGNVKGC